MRFPSEVRTHDVEFVPRLPTPAAPRAVLAPIVDDEMEAVRRPLPPRTAGELEMAPDAQPRSGGLVKCEPDEWLLLGGILMPGPPPLCPAMPPIVAPPAADIETPPTQLGSTATAQTTHGHSSIML